MCEDKTFDMEAINSNTKTFGETVYVEVNEMYENGFVGFVEEFPPGENIMKLKIFF